MDREPGNDIEPTASNRSIPAIMFTLLAAVLFWGDIYVMDHGGDLMGQGGSFPKEVYYPLPSYAALDALHPKDDIAMLIELGRVRYAYYGCVGCHQPGGQGTPGLMPPLAGSEWVNAEGPNRIARIILNGLKGPITVSGKQYNNQMTPFGPVIQDDEEIAAILTFIRQEWGNTGSPVSVEQITTIREADKSRTTQWTVSELQAIPEAD